MLRALLVLVLLFAGCGSHAAARMEEIEPSMPVASDSERDAGDAVITEPDTAPAPEPEPLLAGAARVDATPAIGLPLGGYGDRRRKTPDLDPSDGTTLFEASTGVKDPLFCRALVLARGTIRIGLVAIDGVAVVGHYVDNVIARARAKGSTLTADRTVVFASHTHSGPGAMTHLKFFEIAAMDLHVPAAEDAFAEACASALALAEADLAPARIGTGTVSVTGVSSNRRAGVSPHVTAGAVDTELGVVRVDRPSGAPVAVLWSYAIHGTSLGADNLEFSADVMGVASAAVESALPGIVALFANGAEGDAAPQGPMKATGGKLGEGVLTARASAVLRPTARIGIASHVVDLGEAALVLPPGTFGDLGLGAITSGRVVLGPEWIEHTHRFSAVRIDDEVLVSVPGEALYEIGRRIEASGASLGFAHVTVIGLANGYVGYVTSTKEHEAGGYEASMALFGPGIGDRVVSECTKAMLAVKK